MTGAAIEHTSPVAFGGTLLPIVVWSGLSIQLVMRDPAWVTMTVSLQRSFATMERRTFALLLDNSWQREAREYLEALDQCYITFSKLVALGRSAEIPYALFFAPYEVAAAQVRRKNDVLLQGVSKGAFSVNSRGNVRVTDIELIVKDILRKQQLLKRSDPSMPDNVIVGALKSSKVGAKGDADWLVENLRIDQSYLQRITTKERAFERMLETLEDHNIFVSQSQTNYMPQKIPQNARFSGVCIRDKKAPFLFINNRDRGHSMEPAGRRLMTLTLLAVCLARGKFRPVTYADNSKDLIENREYETAEEILMPATIAGDLAVSSLDDAKEHANTFSVTPSAFVMRARRLGFVKPSTARRYMAELREEFQGRGKDQGRQPKAVNALRKYNSPEYSRSLLRQMDANRLPASEVHRVLLQNKRSVSLSEYRAALH